MVYFYSHCLSEQTFERIDLRIDGYVIVRRRGGIAIFPRLTVPTAEGYLALIIFRSLVLGMSQEYLIRMRRQLRTPPVVFPVFVKVDLRRYAGIPVGEQLIPVPVTPLGKIPEICVVTERRYRVELTGIAPDVLIIDYAVFDRTKLAEVAQISPRQREEEYDIAVGHIVAEQESVFGKPFLQLVHRGVKVIKRFGVRCP